MQDHIKSMNEVCHELSAIGDPVNEEDSVVYLLASLPNVLVTALEANAEVPPLAVVMERLIHEETKAKSHSMQLTQEGALAARSKMKPKCYFCHKVGHIKKDCEEYAKVKGQSDRKVKVQSKSRKPQWEHSKLPSQPMMKTALRAADWWKHRRCQLALPPSGLWSDVPHVQQGVNVYRCRNSTHSNECDA